MKRLIRRKGYTLIELVLAIALTSILAACVSSLIGYALTTRRLADAQSAMYTTSLRLHKAIAAELSASSDVVLYAKIPSTFTAIPATERVMLVKNDRVNLSNTSGTTPLLPIANGFDSYQDVKVVSVTFKLVKIIDHKDADTVATDSFYRAVRITTTVSKGTWTYTHSSTVRFDEMTLKGTQIRVGNSTYTSFSSIYILDAKLKDESTEFPYIRYGID